MEFLNIEGVLIPHQVINIRGDGACMFSSLSYLMYGEDNRAQEVRGQIVQYVCRNWRRFKPFTMMESGDAYKTKALYLKSMMKNDTFGTTCELTVAGELYRYEFQVYRNGIMMITVGEALDGVKRLQFSGDLMRGHFNVLIPQVDGVQASQEILNPLQDNDLMEVEVSNASLIFVDNESISSTETVEQNIRDHRGKKRRRRYTHNIRKKQLIEGNTSYTKKTPEVNRMAVQKYSKANPEVNRKAVKNYTKNNQAVNKKAVTTYRNKHPQAVQQANQNYNELRRKESLKPWSVKSLSAFHYNPEVNYADDKIVSLGDLVTCQWCLAKKWKHESPGLCCCGGKVRLPPRRLLPEPLHSLLTNNHPETEHFLNNLRKYNSCFQMTSFGATEVREGNFMPTFKVQGQVYHRIGSLLPPPELQPAFLQIYFVGDDEKETDIRCQNFPATKPSLVRQLQTMLHQHNPYIREFKIALESTPIEEHFKVVINANKKPADGHKGRFNAPVTNEVAVVIVGQEFDRRDIILHSRDASLKRVSETHRSYDALQYPLMFCFGEDGYAIDIPQRHPDTQAVLNKTVSAASFYAYLIMERQNTENMLLLYRGLLNQFLVDMYAKIETERLNFIRCNQTSLRAENYVHLRDAVQQSDGDIGEIGKMVILPSSFTGGPRYMHERTQDAMTYVRIYGRPDLFITFTSSPKWHDVQEQLKDGQKPQDRHDLVARVFHLKLKQMMNLLTKGQVFGPTICYMYSVEWQKRGLPHAHILLWLKTRIMSADIDKVISAEIPDPIEDPLLHDIVTSTMIHGPCGSINPRSTCMIIGSCSKRFPRPFAKDTQTADDGYPLYRRRSPEDGGRSFNIRNMNIDNRWVVPFNPVLSRTFSAHINVEICNSVKSIKYICKYVNKGSDQAAFALHDQFDEVSRYETGRYISSSEAVWRILCFPIHERFPPVMHLAVHLENGQRVYFTTDNLQQRLDSPTNTTLMAFFKLCQSDSFARTLLYCDVPAYYTWNNKEFNRRKKGTSVPLQSAIKKAQVLGRVYTVHPNNTECYYLRLLLHKVKGPISFQDLRTVDGEVHSSYQSACRALGLLQDDKHWDDTLQEVALSHVPNKIREIFAVLLVYCQVADPLKLWENHKDHMAEDIMHELIATTGMVDAVSMTHIAHNKCLILLEDIVISMSGHHLPYYNLPEPSRSELDIVHNRAYLAEISYDVVKLSSFVSDHVSKLNTCQKNLYDEVVSSIESGSSNLMFLDAPGGTGKTFLINLLLAYVRQNKQIAIAVASSGIAATLLEGGKTAHSAFKLPLNLNYCELPVCNISKQSDMAKILQHCKLIVWDECTMAHKGGIEALNRTLQDLRGNKELMGGLTVLLAGDFRQTLPVVTRGTRADEIKACIKSSFLWPKITIRSLTVNMRVHLNQDTKAEEFSKLLLQIGDGNLPQSNNKISIPSNLCELVQDFGTFIDKIYPSLDIGSLDPLWLRTRAILTPKNDTALIINHALLDKMPGQPTTFESVDTVVEEEDTTNYPVEFLHSLNPPGLPPHQLRLKVGAPIMLLRNLRPPKLCNGTRLQIKTLQRNVIEAIIITGAGQGELVFIPRIPLIPSDYQINFKRIQFPIKLCFAMTINKAQGQTLSMAGIDLREDCFSHGQLYVACSRVSSSKALVIFQPDGITANIVYKDIL